MAAHEILARHEARRRAAENILKYAQNVAKSPQNLPKCDQFSVKISYRLGAGHGDAAAGVVGVGRLAAAVRLLGRAGHIPRHVRTAALRPVLTCAFICNNIVSKKTTEEKGKRDRAAAPVHLAGGASGSGRL